MESLPNRRGDGSNKLLVLSMRDSFPSSPRSWEKLTVFVRDLDLAQHNRFDGRRLEVVTDGFTLWQAAQLAIDGTMVSPVRSDGTARPREDGAALKESRRRMERTYPERAGDGGRARLVVLGAEVDGKWSAETAQLLSALAKARAREVPLVLQARAETAWRKRWSNILACSAARAFASPLLEIHPAPATGDTPSVNEALRDARFA